MWFIILGATLVATILGFLYLVNRIGRFHFVGKLAGTGSRRKILISILLLLIPVVLLCLTMGTMNMMIVILFLTIFWLISDLLVMILRKLSVNTDKLPFYLSGTLAVVLTVIYLGYGMYTAYHVIETDYQVSSKKTEAPLRIGLFADSHVGTTFRGADLEKYLKQMMEANPDLIVISGDFVDDATSYEDMMDACKALSTVHPRLGIYYVFGNHDKGYYASRRGYDAEALRAALTENNVTVLEDDSIQVTDGYTLIGRVDAGETRMPIQELMKDIPDSEYTIVLNHQPNDYENEAEAGVNLVLSGHTHGGQLIPITDVGLWIGANDAIYGHKQMGDTDFIVTSGISDWEILFKTGCYAEYVMVDVIPE